MTDLAAVHVLAQARLRAAVADTLAAAWDGLPGYDRENIDEWLSLAVPVVDAGQRQAAALTDAYLAREMGRDPLGVPAGEVTGAAVRNGTEPSVEWARPFVTVWTQLSRGHDHASAVRAAAARVDAMAATDMQLAMRASAAFVGEADDGIHGYQRVTDGSACVLCLIASTQRYHRGDLMPIHAHCGCSVQPLTSPVDGIVDRGLYRKLKGEGAMDAITRQRQAGGFAERAAANRDRAARWRREMAGEQDAARRARLRSRADRYAARADAQEAEAAAVREGRAGVTAQVVPHGELGPVLVNAAHHFDRLAA